MGLAIQGTPLLTSYWTTSRRNMVRLIAVAFALAGAVLYFSQTRSLNWPLWWELLVDAIAVGLCGGLVGVVWALTTEDKRAR